LRKHFSILSMPTQVGLMKMVWRHASDPRHDPYLGAPHNKVKDYLCVAQTSFPRP
jgi:hypothetical protein